MLFSALLVLSGSGCTGEPGNHEPESREFTSLEMSSEYERFRLVRVAGPFRNAWAVAFLPDGSYLVTERAGRLIKVENGTLHEISGLPRVYARNQGGLMDVVLHPEYESNGWIYITYSKADGNQTATTLIRARLDGHFLVDVEELFVQDRFSSPGRHYGSRLAWMADGTLLMSVGDRGADPPRAQDLGDHAGKLLRLNDDGTPASDNPFIGEDGVLPEIYAYGSRNIQGLVIDPDNDDIWATEHGPRGGDELNLMKAGNNYGWPVVTLGRDYRTEGVYPSSELRQKEGMVDPVYELLPTHAPSGLAMVTSDLFPNWKGNLLAGGLRSERIRRLVIQDYEVIHEEELLLRTIGRIRDVREAPNGHIYVLNDISNGALYRIEPRN